MSSPRLSFSPQNQATLTIAREKTKVQQGQSCGIQGYAALPLTEVSTELDGGEFLDLDKMFGFHNYFSADCWVIAEVYKKKGSATFNLNDVIEMQLQVAGIANRNPRTVILKNVQHEPIKSLDLKSGDISLQATRALIDTPLFKAIDRVVLGRLLDAEKFGENHIRLSFSPLGVDNKA